MSIKLPLATELLEFPMVSPRAPNPMMPSPAEVPLVTVPTSNRPLASRVIAWVNVMALPAVPEGALYHSCLP